MKVGVVGTGMIGASMAALFTGFGHETYLLASSPERIEHAKENWRAIYQTLAERGLATDAQIKACEGRLSVITEYADMAEAVVIFECVKEDEATKFSVYRQIEDHCPACRAIASVSSAMSPDVLQRGCSRMKDRIKWFIIPDHHPAIVDQDTFDRSKASQTRYPQPNKKKRDYPLKGKIFCG